MRDLWYSDNRDLVKWGSLLHLAQRESIKHIFQVVMFRASPLPKLEVDEEEFDLPKEVWTHFRSIRDVKRMGSGSGIEIHVLDETFDRADRKKYFLQIKDEISQISANKIVFLDPDTGIEPKKPKREHVKVAEVELLWNLLKADDWLVLYQHKSRDRDWIERNRRKLQDACEGASVETFSGNAIVKDVVFFAAKKG